MFVIPSKDSKKFSQPNLGDTQGNLWGSFNLDLSKNLGRIRTTRCETIFDETDDADLKLPTAFAFFDWDNSGTTVFVTYAGKIFWGGDDAISPWTQDTLTDTPSISSNQGDMKVFNGKLYVTTATELKRLTPGGASWSINPQALTTGRTHQLCVFDENQRLYIVDEGKKIYSMDIAETVSTVGPNTLDLSPYNGHISWLKAGKNKIWIGFTKNDGTRGFIIEWDGVTAGQSQVIHRIEAQGSAGCAIWNDIPYVLDIEGRLLAFNGSYFDEVARLPILQYDVLNSEYATLSSTKIVHYNGIQYMNDSILMLVDNRNTGESGEQENYPAGIYEYTKENGLIHKFSPSLTRYTEDTVDYGQELVNGTGALFDSTARNTNSTNYYSSVMYGVELESPSGTNLFGINIDIIQIRTNDPDHIRSGYLLTPWIESNQIQDVWKSIVIKYRKFLGTDDKIVVKYRVTKDVPLIAQNAVWNSTTTVTDSQFIGAVSVGDELEVLNGNGAGDMAHVISILDNGSTWTLTLDTPIVGVTAGNISEVRIQKWNKLPDITNTQVQFQDLPLPQFNKDTQVQFKVVMDWLNQDNEVRELVIVNGTEQNAK